MSVDYGPPRTCDGEYASAPRIVSLDLSGEEFLAALDDGKFEDVDPDALPGLLDVLMALPLVR